MPGDFPARLSQAIAHRGPDGAGALAFDGDRVETFDPEVGRHPTLRGGTFVHRRLAIIDLVTGDQPMRGASGATWIIYNGEIYNFVEIRREIQAADDRPFRTRSDTEVILRAYELWGESGFSKLNGIFSLALYDGRNGGAVVLARDPLGVKPLYWGSLSSGGVWFSSELRAPLSLGLIPREVDQDALYQYLYYRFTPAPRTLLRAARKVQPGHAMTFGLDGVLRRDLDFVPPPGPTESRVPNVPGLAVSLATAVRRQTLADVPVGAFLSGGVDSSLVVAAMRKDGSRVHTFGIGFAPFGGRPSELEAAKFAADELRTQHESEVVERDSYLSTFPDSILTVEEPLAHAGIELQVALARSAHRDLKVVLTGQGADEPLGGYPRHQALRLVPALRALGGAHVARWAKRNRKGAAAGTLDRLLSLLSAGDERHQASAMFSSLSYQAVAELARGTERATEDAVLAAVDPWLAKGAALDPIARMLYVDTRTSLVDDLLLVTDKTSMKHSLEARVPFLDLDYLRSIEHITGERRVSAFGSRKWLQHAIAKVNLPPNLAASLAGTSKPWRRKRGFDVPVSDWLKASTAHRARGFLCEPDAMVSAYLSRDHVESAFNRFRAGSSEAYRVVFSLLALEIWLRQTIRGDSPTETRVSLSAS